MMIKKILAKTLFKKLKLEIKNENVIVNNSLDVNDIKLAGLYDPC